MLWHLQVDATGTRINAIRFSFAGHNKAGRWLEGFNPPVGLRICHREVDKFTYNGKGGMGALTRPAANRKTNTPVGAAYPGTHYNLWGQPYNPVIGSILGCTRFAGYILRNIVFA